TEIGHERPDVGTAAARFMQRVFEQHVRRGNLVDDGKIDLLPQNSVNQRPTMALLSASLLIGMPPHHRLRADHRHRSMIRAKTYDLGGRANLRFWPWNRKGRARRRRS